MKIEKISETQVKFILSQVDLAERNLKLTELAYGTEKTQALFREMMEQAVLEFGIEFDNTPIMIEAIPLSPDSIIIIVTKVMETADIEAKFNSILSSHKSQRVQEQREPKVRPAPVSNTTVFCFDDLDSVMDSVSRLSGRFDGTSMLFKNDGKYFLFMEKDTKSDYTDISQGDIEAVLSEYGSKYSDNPISRYYLEEHGEVLIRSRAVDILASI